MWEFKIFLRKFNNSKNTAECHIILEVKKCSYNFTCQKSMNHVIQYVFKSCHFLFAFSLHKSVNLALIFSAQIGKIGKPEGFHLDFCVTMVTYFFVAIIRTSSVSYIFQLQVILVYPRSCQHVPLVPIQCWALPIISALRCARARDTTKNRIFGL